MIFWKDGLNLAYFPVFTNLKARASVSSIRILVTNYLSYFFSLEIYQLKKIYLLLTTSALSKENENRRTVVWFRRRPIFSLF